MEQTGNTAAAFHSPISVRKGSEEIYRIYPEDSFDHLGTRMADLSPSGRRIAVITDSHVEKLYLREVLDKLRPVCAGLSSFVIQAGEEHKNLDWIRKILTHLIENRLDRHDIVVALGGGVVGDMAGFAAACYLRGIRFVQIPTTLLSQVDSSIGGKTGVDFDKYKNMVGAFHQPSMVYLNISTLQSLDGLQFASGMGEVLKHGLIRDAGYYEWLLDHMEAIEERDSATLLQMVVRSVNIKREIVEKDPEEMNDRALLNFGHTAGHAIERLKDFSLAHGQCVALGCVVAAYISWQRKYLDDDTFYEIRDMFVGFDLPISFDSLQIEDILRVMKLDKKMDKGQLRFILLHQLGDAFIDRTVTDEEIRKALAFIDADLHQND